ncbi:MAG: hypothetical protein ABUS79_13380 [Pseudomonadota bacterium]
MRSPLKTIWALARRAGNRVAGASRWGLLLFALAGVALFLRQMHQHYPVQKWLFWSYALAWLYATVFGAACLCAGYPIVTRVLRLGAPLRESLLISAAVGVFVFAAGVFVAGLFHGLGRVFFFAWPLGLIAFGAEPLVRKAVRARRLLRSARLVVRPPPWWGGVALVFGLAGVALLYVNIMTPANVAYDSRWYHLALAEHYAAAGAVTRFPEGWFCGTYPHLASLLYTWAFLVPGGDLVARIELAAHIELVLFLATLAGVSALVRWCTAGAGVRVRNAWAALFLFPGILLYDSILSVAADHVLAFWAAPLFLLFRRTLRTWRLAPAVLLGLVMAGALMTKYQAVYLLAVPAAGVAGAGFVRLVRARRWGRLAVLGPVVTVVVAAGIFTTPLWLKNWIWYGDPVYPLLNKVFAARPWEPGTDPDKLLQIAAWTPQGPLADRVRETLKATVTFSFISHDWWNHHAATPIFGSLFTLTLPLLLFVGPRRRTLGLALATMVGIAVWYWTYHQDRYLQALLPWMAAVTAAVLVMAWRRGWAGRIAVAALVAVQVVWGGDVYSIPGHGMIGTQPVRMVLDLVSSGFRQDWALREQSHQDFAPLAPHLPKGSVLLIHERMTRLGHGVVGVVDLPGTQGGIAYSTLGSPRRVYERLREFGVTHVAWAPGTPNYQTRVEDLVFFEFAEKYTVSRINADGFVLAKMPPQPPPEVPEPRLVRVQLCASARTVLVNQLDRALAGEAFPDSPYPGPPAFFVVQTACAALPTQAASDYRLLVSREGYDMWGLKGQ